GRSLPAGRDHRPARPELVRARASRSVSLPAVRALEPGLAAWARHLPARDRAPAQAAGAGAAVGVELSRLGGGRGRARLRERGLSRHFTAAAFIAAATTAVIVLRRGVAAGVAVQIAAYAACLFAACMACHGELARRRPAPARLTGFYLLVALGGALGGGFV